MRSDCKPKSLIGIAPVRLGVSKSFILLFISFSFIGAFTGYLWAEEPTTFISFLEKGLLKVPATRDIKIGDLNGDGSLDLIFLTPVPEVFWVSLGDGRGNFALPKKHGLGKGYSNEVVRETIIMGDFNGDGKDEILYLQKRRISSETKEATIFLVSSSLDEEGIFKERLAIPVYGTLTPSHGQLLLFNRDIDGDKRSDFILGDRFFKEIFVLKNTRELWTSSLLDFSFGDITRIDLKLKVGVPYKKRPFQVLMLDVDNDGFSDILKVGEDEIFMVRGDRNRVFITSERAINQTLLVQPEGFSMGLNPTIIYGNLNRDDFLDLLVINDSGKGWILINKGGKGFNALFVIDFSIAPLIRLGDFNGDGLDDLLAYGRGLRGIKILLNGGEGHFTTLIERSLGDMFVNTLSVHDINRDGLTDIILTVYNPQTGIEGRVLLNISQVLRD